MNLPTFSHSSDGPRHATVEHAQEAQAVFYSELMALYSMNDIGNERGSDYVLVLSQNNIHYYIPNDEGWGSIIAVSHGHRLAIVTGFYDTADMESDEDEAGTEYAYMFHDGCLKRIGEVE